jgi:hypothetical protein
LIQENAKRGRTDLGSIVAVWFILEKETADRKALLQSFAARWLSGHLLLPGNLLTLSYVVATVSLWLIVLIAPV